MTPELGKRVQALPRRVLDALWDVPGPGWVVRLDGAIGPHNERPDADWRASLQGWEWWPANPAAAVAAICVTPGQMALQVAHELLAVRMGDTAEDDHAAALGLIEAHTWHTT